VVERGRSAVSPHELICLQDTLCTGSNPIFKVVFQSNSRLFALTELFVRPVAAHDRRLAAWRHPRLLCVTM